MNKQVLAGIIITILLVVIGGTFIVMRRQKGPTPTPTPQFSPTEEPTPTPEVEADISQFKIKVLNGTAIAGLAAKVKTQLETAGFTVSDVGNAATKDFQAVQIEAKDTIPTSVLTKLKEELQKEYTIGTEKTLDSKDENDIIVTLGSKTQPTAKPVATGTNPTVTAGPTSATTPTQSPSPTKIP